MRGQAPDQTEDARELVARAASGDRDAFRRLYDRFFDRVYHQVGRMLGYRDDLDDAVQDVFLQLHRSLPNYRGDAKFATWLFRLTHNVTVSHLRRQFPHVVDLTALSGLWDTLVEPDFDARKQLRALYVALDEMNPQSREAFVLFEVEGLSLKEIATTTGAPFNTVAARVRRARERLRKLIGRSEKVKRRRAS